MMGCLYLFVDRYFLIEDLKHYVETVARHSAYDSYMRGDSRLIEAPSLDHELYETKKAPEVSERSLIPFFRIPSHVAQDTYIEAFNTRMVELIGRGATDTDSTEPNIENEANTSDESATSVLSRE